MQQQDFDFRHSRAVIPVTVVCANRTYANQLRHILKNLGFGNISSHLTYADALNAHRVESTALMFFDTHIEDINGADFVEQVLDVQRDVVIIPFSHEPRVDDVFSLLRAGARHFVTLPFQGDKVEEIILRAAEGPAIQREILQSGDRNTALAGAILNLLDKVTLLQRDVREIPSIRPLLSEHHSHFAELTEIARALSEGSPEKLREKIVLGCLERAEAGTKTRLGRARIRLRRQRDLRKSNSFIIERPIPAPAR